MSSQYINIKRVRYERDLIEFAEAKTAKGRQMWKLEAEELWEMAMDGGRITPTEERTLKKIVDEYGLHPAAKRLLQAKLSSLSDAKTPAPSEQERQSQPEMQAPSHEPPAREIGLNQDGELHPGDRVEIFGLENESCKHLNGQVGTVLEFIQERHRFFIRVGSEKEVSVKRESLRRINAPVEEGADQDDAGAKRKARNQSSPPLKKRKEDVDSEASTSASPPGMHSLEGDEIAEPPKDERSS